jgi:hypothetical protein
MLNQLQIHRKILYDLVVHYLEPLNSTYGRLAYLSGLRDPGTGKYAHEKLAAVYGEEPVAEAIAKCHEEMFERLLEMPLAQQEEDLRTYVNALPNAIEWNEKHCVETTRSWVPREAPDYLKELFCSNTAALCELLRNTPPKHGKK